jgi:hypothetical protein
LDRENTALFLKEAVLAFREVERTADACIEHARTCTVCRSRVLRYFFRCAEWEGAVYDCLAAKAAADQYSPMIEDVRLEMEASDANAEWCQNLYRLEDNR